MKKSSTKTFSRRFKTILIVIAALLLILQFIWNIVLTARIGWLEADTNKRENDVAIGLYESTVTRFCYDHSIQPCDDSHIAAWNTTHPTDRITPTNDLFPPAQ